MTEPGTMLWKAWMVGMFQYIPWLSMPSCISTR